MRTSLALPLCLASVACSSSAAVAPLAAADKPNVLFIFTDNQRWDTIAALGNREIKTANTDRLVNERFTFDNGELRIGDEMLAAFPRRPREIRQHLADYYATISHMDHEVGRILDAVKRAIARPVFGLGLHQYGLWFGMIDYFTHMRDGQLDWHRDDQPCRDEGYSTNLLAEEACRRIREKQPGKPLFLYLPFNAVHSPHQVPDRYLEPYANLTGVRRIYAGMVAAMDEAVGQVVDALDERGLRDNTLIIFSSDNGACAEWDPFGFDLNPEDFRNPMPGHGINGSTPGKPNTLHAADALGKGDGDPVVREENDQRVVSKARFVQRLHHPTEGVVAAPRGVLAIAQLFPAPQRPTGRRSATALPSCRTSCPARGTAGEDRAN